MRNSPRIDISERMAAGWIEYLRDYYSQARSEAMDFIRNKRLTLFLIENDINVVCSWGSGLFV